MKLYSKIPIKLQDVERMSFKNWLKNKLFSYWVRFNMRFGKRIR